MNGAAYKKKVNSVLWYGYKLGVIRYLSFTMAMLTQGAAYKLKFKGWLYHLRKKSTDFKVFCEVAVFELYKIRKIDIGPVKTIVDLGSNIGMSALFFNRKYPDALIVCVEPEKNNYKQMLKNVADYSNIHCLNTAIWHTNKNLVVYDCGHGEYGFRVTEEHQQPGGDVAAITIDDIITKYNLQTIDILKIDIEGAEKELFSANYENWLPKVRCIIIELHDSFKPGCASSFFKAISGRDYTLLSKGDNITIIFN